ncbi:NADH-quinone oxidoreductase subunit NuoN [bacterium AH-315-J23]|nr:NADH-quinone oxidoreductase subunit NuoN [bacterium AH-315-J23]PHQ66276.1 MAG: NADH-quinone oxidoreductase subunit NuoN [Robiginitomaculum sp.]
MGQLSFLTGEVVLAVSAVLLLLVGAFGGKSGVSIVRYASITALVIFAFAGFIINGQGTAFGGAFIADDFSHYVKALIGLTAAATLWFSRDWFKQEKLDQFEYSILMLFAVLGMGIMVSAGNLLSMYVGLELQALSLYVMAAFNRDSLRASEAGLKYFVLGALSSGMLLYGMSLIYGFTGTLSFAEIGSVISGQEHMSAGIIAGLVFMLAGMAFKISAAPFHMWTPDVYEGAPTPVTGFFAGAPKLAALALITRLITGPFGEAQHSWQQVIIVLAVMSMVIGAFGALTQTNIKRLLAYSSIANMGYALVALAAGGAAGVSGMLMFMSIYLVTIVGTFAAILQMRTREGALEGIADLGGLSKSNLPLSLILTILMFSLAGIPFFMGFFGKWFAFAPAFNSGLTWLVVIALLSSVIGAFYYLRIIKVIWFDDQAHEFVKAPRSLAVLSSFSAILLFPVLLLPVVTAPTRALIEAAASSLF